VAALRLPDGWRSGVCYKRGVRPQTATKLAVAGVICVFFAGFVLRAAMRLAATAMHSILFAAILVVLVVWVFAKSR
jgi:hypothetical protein